MESRRLRQVVSLAAAAAAVATGVVVGLNPLPDAQSSPQPVTADFALEVTIARREARASAQLQVAERRLLEAAAAADAVPAPLPPSVYVAPAPVAPVTRSASS